MDNYLILIDDREKNVIPFFEKIDSDIKYKIDRLTVGDYSVLYKDKILFIIERKTWVDLAASIKDGRKDNMQKMIDARTETGCHLFYLMEGTPIPSRTARYGRIPYKNLRSHLDHACFRDNIHTIHSKNQHDTAIRINELVKNYISFMPIVTEITGGIAILKKKQAINPQKIIYSIWKCIPGITEISASIFISEGYHISDLILGKISKNTIYALKYPSGVIIGKKANKILNASSIKQENNKNFIKMLSQINGITKDAASVILSNINFTDLLNGSITLELLSNVKKSESKTHSKIGKKKASELIQFFQKLKNK